MQYDLNKPLRICENTDTGCFEDTDTCCHQTGLSWHTLIKWFRKLKYGMHYKLQHITKIMTKIVHITILCKKDRVWCPGVRTESARKLVRLALSVLRVKKSPFS